MAEIVPYRASTTGLCRSAEDITRLKDDDHDAVLDDLQESEVIVGDDSDEEVVFNGEVREEEEVYVADRSPVIAGHHRPTMAEDIKLLDPDKFGSYFFIESPPLTVDSGSSRQYVTLSYDNWRKNAGCGVTDNGYFASPAPGMFEYTPHRLESLTEEEETENIPDEAAEIVYDTEAAAVSIPLEEYVQSSASSVSEADSTIIPSYLGDAVDKKCTNVDTKASTDESVNDTLKPSEHVANVSSSCALKLVAGSASIKAPLHTVLPPESSTTKTSVTRTLPATPDCNAQSVGIRATLPRSRAKQAATKDSSKSSRTSVIGDKKKTDKAEPVVAKGSVKAPNVSTLSGAARHNGKGPAAAVVRSTPTSRVLPVERKSSTARPDKMLDRKLNSVLRSETSTVDVKRVAMEPARTADSSRSSTIRPVTKTTSQRADTKSVLERHPSLRRSKKPALVSSDGLSQGTPEELKRSADTYGTLGRRKKRPVTSSDPVDPPSGSSVSAVHPLVSRSTTASRPPAANSTRAASSTATSSSTRSSAARPPSSNVQRTLICLEASSQTVLTAGDLCSTDLQTRPDVERAERGSQAEIDDPRCATLFAHIGRLQQEAERSRHVLAQRQHVQMELAETRRALHAGLSERDSVQAELDRATERIATLQRDLEAAETTTRHQLLESDQQLQLSQHAAEELQRRLDETTDSLHRLTEENDKSSLSQSILLRQVRESEAESRELLDFMQMEKNALSDALRDAETKLSAVQPLSSLSDQLEELEQRYQRAVELTEVKENELDRVRAELYQVESRCDQLLPGNASAAASTNRTPSWERAGLRLAELAGRLERAVLRHRDGCPVGSDRAVAAVDSQMLRALDLGCCAVDTAERRNPPDGAEASKVDDGQTEGRVGSSSALHQQLHRIETLLLHSDPVSPGDRRSDAVAEDQVSALREQLTLRDRQLNEMRLKYSQHKSILTSNVQRAESEIQTLDDIIDYVINSMSSASDVVRDDPVLWKLWLDLGGPQKMSDRPKRADRLSARTQDETIVKV